MIEGSSTAVGETRCGRRVAVGGPFPAGRDRWTFVLEGREFIFRSIIETKKIVTRIWHTRLRCCGFEEQFYAGAKATGTRLLMDISVERRIDIHIRFCFSILHALKSLYRYRQIYTEW